jgi:hypothetical protein
MSGKQRSQFISIRSTNIPDLTWSRLGVTAVESQFILLPISPLLKVVQTLVIVLHLQTIQYNTIQYEGICYSLTQTLQQTNIPVQMPGHFLWEWTCLDAHFAGTTWRAYSSVFSSNFDVQSGPRCPAPDREYNYWILTQKIGTKSYVWVENIKKDQV